MEPTKDPIKKESALGVWLGRTKAYKNSHSLKMTLPIKCERNGIEDGTEVDVYCSEHGKLIIQKVPVGGQI